MPESTFAARLRTREPLVGSVLTLASVPLAELLAAPLDFVWIDLEHGALDAADVPSLAVAARAASCAALVRLPSCDADRVGALLDAGVDGIVAPGVETPDQARRLVASVRRPPLGVRGAATRRSSDYGRAREREPVLLAQIESVGAVANAEQIAAVDGVDALVVGCADLAASLGADGDQGLRSGLGDEGLRSGLDADEGLRSAVARVRAAARDAGVAFGIAGPGDPELLVELAGDGCTVHVHSADVRMYARVVDAEIGELRKQLARRRAYEEEFDGSDRGVARRANDEGDGAARGETPLGSGAGGGTRRPCTDGAPGPEAARF